MQQNVAVNSIIKEQNKIYYNKSLALQWRIATGVEESLKLSRVQFETTMKQLENIVHNTSLPEAVKITNMELAGQRIKQIAFDTMSESLYKKVAPLEKIKANILKRLRDKVQDAVDVVDMASEGVGMGVETYQQMREYGMGPQELVGGQIGGWALNKLYGLIGKSLPEKQRRSLEHALIAGANSPLDYLRSKRSQNPTGLFGKLKNKGIDWFTGIADSGETTERVKLSFKGLNQPAIFDGRTHRTLNIVIPELLSKIHNETRAIGRKVGATAFEEDELKYDATKNSFITKKDMKANLVNTVARLTSDAKKFSSGMAKEIGDTLSKVEIKDKDVIIATELPRAIKLYYAKYGTLSPEAMVSDKRFMAFIKPQYQLATMSLLQEYLVELKRGNKTSSAYNMFKNAASMLTMPPALIEKYVNGMGGDMLNDFIRRDSATGEEELNANYIRSLYTGEATSLLGRRISRDRSKTYNVDNKMYKNYDTGEINFTDDLMQSGKNYYAWATNRQNTGPDYWKEGGSYTNELGVAVKRGIALTEEERDELNNKKRMADELDAYIKSPEVSKLLNSDLESERKEGEKLVAKKQRELEKYYNKKSLLGRIYDVTRMGNGKSIFNLSDAYKQYKESGSGSYSDFITNRIKSSSGYQTVTEKLDAVKSTAAYKKASEIAYAGADVVKKQVTTHMELIKSTETYKHAEARFKSVVERVTNDPRIQALDSATRAKYVLVADYVTTNLDKAKQTRAIQTLLEMNPEELEKKFKVALNASKSRVGVYKDLVDKVIGQEEGAMSALAKEFKTDYNVSKGWVVKNGKKLKEVGTTLYTEGSILGKEKYNILANKAKEFEQSHGILNTITTTASEVTDKAKDVYLDLREGVTQDTEADILKDTVKKKRSSKVKKDLQRLEEERIRREYKPIIQKADEATKNKILLDIKNNYGLDIDFSKRAMRESTYNSLLELESNVKKQEQEEVINLKDKTKTVREKKKKVAALKKVMEDINNGVSPVAAVKKQQGILGNLKDLTSSLSKKTLGLFNKQDDPNISIQDMSLVDTLNNAKAVTRGKNKKTKEEQQIQILNNLINNSEQEITDLTSSLGNEGVNVEDIDQQSSKQNNKGKDYSHLGPDHWRNKKRLKYIGQFDFIHRLINDKSIRNPIGAAMFLAGQTMKASYLGTYYGAKYGMYKIPKAIWTSKIATRLRAWEREKYKQSLVNMKKGFSNLLKNKFYIPDILMFAGKALSTTGRGVQGLWNSKTAMALREAERGFLNTKKESEGDREGKSWLGTLMAFLRMERLAGEAHAEGLTELTTQQLTANTEQSNSILGGFFNYVFKRDKKKDKVEEENTKEENNTKTWKDKIRESWENTKEKWRERGRKLKGYFTGPTGPNGEKEGLWDKVTRIGTDALKAGAAGGLLYMLIDKDRRASLVEGVKGFAHGLSVVWDVIKSIGKGLGYVLNKLSSAWDWLKSKMPSFMTSDDDDENKRPDGTIAQPGDPDYKEPAKKDHSQAFSTGEALAYGGVAALAARPIIKIAKGVKAIGGAIATGGKYLWDKAIKPGWQKFGQPLVDKYKAGYDWNKQPKQPTTMTSEAAKNKPPTDKQKMANAKKAAKAGAKIDPKDIPTSEKKSVAKKIMGILESFKEKAIKKLGPKAGVKLTAIIGSKIAARAIPIVGWGLLLWDAGWIIKYMLDGMSLASATSLQILGFDIFDDSSEARDEDGNLIQPDENISVNASDTELKEAEVTQVNTTVKEDEFEQVNKDKIKGIQSFSKSKATMEKFQESIKERDNRKEKLKQLNIDFVRAFKQLTNDERSVELVTKNKGNFIKYGAYKDGVYFLGEPIISIVWDPTKSYLWIGNYTMSLDPKEPATVTHVDIAEYIKRMKALHDEGVDVGIPKDTSYSFEELYKALLNYKVNAIKAAIIATARVKGRDQAVYEANMVDAIGKPATDESKANDVPGAKPSGGNVASPGIGEVDAQLAKDKAMQINMAANRAASVGNNTPPPVSDAEAKQKAEELTKLIEKQSKKPAAVAAPVTPVTPANNTGYKPSPTPTAAVNAAPKVANNLKKVDAVADTKGLDPKVSKMVNWVVKNRIPPGNGRCAKHVRLAIEHGGFRDANGKRIEQAYGYYEKNPFRKDSRTYAINFHDNGILAANGFTQIDPNSPLQVGDIEVYRNGKYPGHIQIYTGSNGWVSDFKQSSRYANQKKYGSALKNGTVYRYRYMGGQSLPKEADQAGDKQGTLEYEEKPDTSGDNSVALAAAKEEKGTLGGSSNIVASNPVSNASTPAAAPAATDPAGSVAPSAPAGPIGTSAATTPPAAATQPGVNMDGVTGALAIGNKTQQAQLSAAEESNLLLKQMVDMLAKQGEIDPASTRIQNQKQEDQAKGNTVATKPSNAMNTTQAPRGNGNGSPSLGYNVNRTA